MEIIAVILILLFIVAIYNKMPEATKKEPSLYDKLLEANVDIIKGVGNPYVDMFSKEEIADLLRVISEEFDKIALERNERVSGNQKLFILNEIIFASGVQDKKFGIEHLNYGLDRYRKFGMRKDNNGLIKEE